MGMHCINDKIAPFALVCGFKTMQKGLFCQNQCLESCKSGQSVSSLLANRFLREIGWVLGPDPKTHLRYHGRIMPSWNIHTAHVERLLADCRPEELGIGDANAFLFGNYVPDIHVGFMVPDASYHIDYCMTHLALPNVIPVPDADRFWDIYLGRRAIPDQSLLSLTLGAWAHLVADRFYNGWFRAFCQEHDVPDGEELRRRKQDDFDAFGRSLALSARVDVNPDLERAAQAFRPYSVLPRDVVLSVGVASAIVDLCVEPACDAEYRLLNAEWMSGVFEACNERIALWLGTWQSLARCGQRTLSADIRAAAGIAPPTLS